MREVSCQIVKETIAGLCRKANIFLPADITAKIEQARQKETSETGQAVLSDISKNARLARQLNMPICQDTGMAVVFVELGQDVHLIDGSLEEAINAGVAEGYTNGHLRASVVADPLIRQNSGDNTPAVIHYSIVSGDRLRLTVAPKGFGSENMSAAILLSPAQGVAGIRHFVLQSVEKAGSNPCPPVVIGLGIGGTLEKAALLAKQALLRPADSHHPLTHIADLEKQLLEEVNQLGIGPAGLGGKTTALAVLINTYATHIAGLPVVLNMSCHATRHADAII